MSICNKHIISYLMFCQDFRSATALCSSPDGAFIFLGLPNGLAAIYAMSQEILSVWEEENTEICSIHSQVISSSAYLLDTIDDMGMIIVNCDYFSTYISNHFIFDSRSEELNFISFKSALLVTGETKKEMKGGKKMNKLLNNVCQYVSQYQQLIICRSCVMRSPHILKNGYYMSMYV